MAGAALRIPYDRTCSASARKKPPRAGSVKTLQQESLPRTAASRWRGSFVSSNTITSRDLA
jgi:hypothetical protein